MGQLVDREEQFAKFDKKCIGLESPTAPLISLISFLRPKGRQYVSLLLCSFQLQSADKHCAIPFSFNSDTTVVSRFNVPEINPSALMQLSALGLV